MRKFLGYRIADIRGCTTRSDIVDPEHRRSCRILNSLEAQEAIRMEPDRILLKPVFEGDVEVPVYGSGKRLIGYQIANGMGENIQGDDGDPSGHPSFYVMDASEILEVIRNSDLELLVMPIFEGDIENPEFMHNPRKSIA